MHRWSHSNDGSRAFASDQEGSAALEFLVVGMILLVPLAYLIVALATLQSSALGVESAARFAARSVATAPSPDHAADNLSRTLDIIAEEYNIDPTALEFQIACVPATTECPQAGATVIVTVRTLVALPLAPAVGGFRDGTSIPVEASAVQKISRFWSPQ